MPDRVAVPLEHLATRPVASPLPRLALGCPRRPLAIAHRGDSAHSPENTLEALEGALAAGVDAIEVDVRLTADDVPVLLHDRSLERTHEIERQIDEVRFAELRTWQASRGTPFARVVPTLAEVLAFVDGRTRLLLELKAPEIESESGLVNAVVGALGRDRESVTLISFDPGLLRQARALAPEIPLGINYEPRHGLHPTDLASELGTSLLLLPMVALAAVPRFQDMGFFVLAYTANGGSAIDAARASGADGVLSDDPGELVGRLGRPVS